MPLVSVIMATHRRTPFLPLAVNSVLRQTLSDLELVLVDDGAGLTADDLGPGGHDPRLRWVRLPENRGIPFAHNAAVAAATGHFIAFFDADDVCLPQRLARQVDRLQAEPSLGLCSGVAESIDEDGRVTGRVFGLIDSNQQRLFSTFDMPVLGPTLCGRTESIRRYRYRALFTAASDYDFYVRFAENEPVACVAEPLLHYRRHPGQTSRTQHLGQVLAANCVRLATQRRRAGQPEDLTGLARMGRDNAGHPWSVSAQYRFFGDISLAEGHAVLAVYFSRKLMSVSRHPGDWQHACRVAARAGQRSPGNRIELVRLFLTGPLRTYGLRPA